MDNRIYKHYSRRDKHELDVYIRKGIRDQKKALGENRRHHYHYWGHDLWVTVVGHNKAIVEDDYISKKDDIFNRSVYNLPVSKLSFTNDKSFYHSLRNCTKHGDNPVDSYKIYC